MTVNQEVVGAEPTRPANNKGNKMEKLGRWSYYEDGKTADGHKSFTARCDICGHTKHGVRLGTLMRTKDGPCTHTNYYPQIPSRLVHTHKNMIRRCYNQTNKDYRFYGAKGVTVCDDWLNDPRKFFDWALSSGYTDTMTIDRIDSTKGYGPDNCRWLDNKTNAKLKTTTRLITIDGVIDSLSGWAARTNTPKTTIVNWSKNRTDEEVIEYIKKKSL